ncbi:extracellular solute-binding protein [Microlunatus sp. Y2014]|uniref:extracellular solute-binding protein n=1 Tax=Microlunatus sp. Y2014 TaxID=3418488 RepID=UPI003DA77F55
MINRRQLLALGGSAAALGGGLGVAGCGPSGDGGGSGGAGGGAEGFAKPTFQPFTGVEATKPALENGTAPYFETFPKNPPSMNAGTPGKGGKVTCHTFMNSTPAPMAENKWWQALNEAVGVEFDIMGAPIGDYPAKFQTTVASNELPDLMAVLPTSTPELAALLKAKCQDLTEHLAGDAILEYPALANIPQYVWDACTYNGRIYTLPIHRFALTHGYAIRTDVAEERGANTAPKSGEEFHEMLTNLSDKKNKWFATNNVVWLVELVAEMMGVPNDWGADGDSFVKDIEVPQYTEALQFVRQCYAEDLIHPSCWDLNFSLQTQALYNSGDAPLVLGGLTWMGNASNARKEDPDAQSNSFQLMKWDGSGPAERYVGGGAPYQTMMNKASDERVKELLGVVNWLAAPWGTQENVLFRNGIEGLHHTKDATGAMTGTDLAKVDSMGPMIYMGSGPQVHFNAYADIALGGYEHEAEAMELPLYSATAGLESPTEQTKNALLNKLLTASRGDIISGRKPVSSWAETVEEWKSKGGEDARNEFAEAKQAKG